MDYTDEYLVTREPSINIIDYEHSEWFPSN